MQFPNAYKGVKKIYIAELLMLFAAVAAIVMIVMMVVGGAGENLDANQMQLSDTQAGVVGGLTIVVSLLAIVGFILMLVGVINAKKDDDNFKVALYAILLGIVISGINAGVRNSYPKVESWLTLATSICSLFSTYFILGGIGSLAERMGDGKVKTLADKARNVLCFTFAASYLLKLIPEFIPDKTVSAVVSAVGGALEIISYGFFLVVLSKGKRMLAA